MDPYPILTPHINTDRIHIKGLHGGDPNYLLLFFYIVCSSGDELRFRYDPGPDAGRSNV
jgi:hypothetical protein